MTRFALVLLALGIMAPPAAGHEVVHRVEREGAAVVVMFDYAGGGPFNFETVEIFRPGEDTPYQTGRTDAKGRVAFLPDGAGAWRLRTFSADGHGGEFTIALDEAGVPVAEGVGSENRLSGLLGGLGILLGAFALMSLFMGRGKG